MSEKIVYPSEKSIFNGNDIKHGIKRTSQIDTISHYLKETQVIYINAPAGIGKSTILKQILENIKLEAITLFLSKEKLNTITDTDIYKDLYLQVKTYMNLDISQDIHRDISKIELEKLYKQLTYFLKHQKRTIYFIIDDIYYLDEGILPSLLLSFPTDDCYKFIISRNSSEQSYYITSKNYENFSINIFSKDEVKELLRIVSNEELEQIRNSFGFSPEVVSFIKELIDKGIPLEDILQYPSNKLEDLFESEWNRVVIDKFKEDIIGLTVFCIEKPTIEELSRFTKATESDLSNEIEKISFLSIENKFITFSSSSSLAYCKKKLAKKKDNYISIFLETLGQDSTNASKLAYYYAEQNNHSQVLKVIDNNHLLSIFEKTNSLNEVNKIINYGIKSSKEIGKEDDFIKYKLLKSGISNIFKSELMTQQLKFHLAENDLVNARAIVTKSRTNEEMLQLYCIFAMHLKMQDIEVDKDITDKIEFLYNSIDANETGAEKVIDICADLLPIYPEKALSLINKLDSFNVSGQNKSDYAFLNLSILTLQRHGDSFTTNIEKEGSKSITRSTVINTIKNFNTNTPPDKLLEFFKTFEESGDRIFLARAWLKNNSKNENALVILRNQIEDIISSTEFSIDASLISDITECLNYSESSDCFDIVDRLSTQLELIKKKGPTIDYCRLVLNLTPHYKTKSLQRAQINELVDYCMSLTDKAVSLATISIIKDFEKKHGLKNELYNLDEIKDELFNNIIKTDALHIKALKETFTIEAKCNFKTAVSWSQKLNNCLRRSKALSIVIEKYLDSLEKNATDRNLNDIISLIKQVKEEEYRQDIYYLIVEKYKYFHPSKSNTKKLLRLLRNIQNNFIKSRCIINLYSSYFKYNCLPDINEIIKTIENAINHTDGDENKAELSFYACEKLINIDKKNAEKFKERALSIIEKTGYSNESLLIVRMCNIELLIRYIYISCLKNLESRNHFDFIIKEIISVGSEIKKARLLSRLVSAYQKTNKLNYSSEIIEKHILPSLEHSKITEGKEFLLYAMYCLPVVHFYEENTFNDWFSTLPKNNNTIKDKIINITINYIYENCLIGDPYDPIKNKFSVGYGDLRKILNLIKLIQEDGNSFYELKRVINTASQLRKKQKITKIQENDIYSSIISTYRDAYPKQNYISHIGYKILLLSELKNVSEKSICESWDDIIKMCEYIDNLSDKAFVMSELSKNLPESHHKDRELLFEDSVKIVNSLSTTIEKVNRYKVIIANHKDYDKSGIKEHLKTAFMLSNNLENNYSNVRLELIDMINSYGDSFSSSLVSMLDDDPARKQKIAENIQKRKNEEDLKKKFQSNTDISSNCKTTDIVRILWSQLGIINANSGHIPKGFCILKYIEKSDCDNIENIYKLISYHMHSSFFRNQTNTCIDEKILPLQKAFCDSLTLINKIYPSEFVPTYNSNKLDDNDFSLISPGENEKAKMFIKKWFNSSESNELIIIDPYIKISDFEFISDIISKDPSITVRVLTSIESKTSMEKSGDIDDILPEYWKESISKTEPPSIEFIFISYGKNKDFPIHDRFWLAGVKALSSGTSINGLGNRTSKLNILPLEESSNIIESMNPYINRSKKLVKDERVRYTTIQI